MGLIQALDFRPEEGAPDSGAPFSFLDFKGQISFYPKKRMNEL
jgi:hypothetical protein